MIKIDSHVPAPKARRSNGAMPANVERAIAAYRKAYKEVYGVSALEITYSNSYIHVEGKNGVSLQIFKSRIKQLQYRKG